MRFPAKVRLLIVVVREYCCCLKQGSFGGRREEYPDWGTGSRSLCREMIGAIITDLLLIRDLSQIDREFNLMAHQPFGFVDSIFQATLLSAFCFSGETVLYQNSNGLRFPWGIFDFRVHHLYVYNAKGCRYPVILFVISLGASTFLPEWAMRPFFIPASSPRDFP